MVKRLVTILASFLCFSAMVNAQILVINDLNQLRAATNGKWAILKFSAVWCGPCRASLPLFEELSNNNNYKDVLFIEINVEEGKEIANYYKIRGIPAFVCIKGKDIVGKVIGFDSKTKNELTKLLDKLVKS